MKATTAIVIALALAGPAAHAGAEEAWLAWAEPGRDPNPVYVSRLDGGTWKTEICPGAASFSRNYLPCPAPGDDGTLWLVWAAQKGNAEAKVYCSRRENGTWTTPERVGGAGSGWESNPVAAAGSGGAPWVAWAGAAGGSSEIFCARRIGDRFEEAEMISRPDGSPDT